MNAIMITKVHGSSDMEVGLYDDLAYKTAMREIIAILPPGASIRVTSALRFADNVAVINRKTAQGKPGTIAPKMARLLTCKEVGSLGLGITLEDMP